MCKSIRTNASEPFERCASWPSACPHIIAVSSWLAEQAPGREVKAQLPESIQSLRERFEVPIQKLGRLLVVEDAWIAALRAAQAARPRGAG